MKGMTTPVTKVVDLAQRIERKSGPTRISPAYSEETEQPRYDSSSKTFVDMAGAVWQ